MKIAARTIVLSAPRSPGRDRSRRENRHDQPGLQVLFVGRCHQFKGIPVSGLIRHLGLNGFVRLEGLRPHEQVRSLLREADVLLLFAQHQPFQVPNKLYEYLATGTSIMAFVDREGESARLLREVGGAELLFEPEVDDVSAALERLFARKELPDGISRAERRSPPAELRTDVQLGYLVAELARRFRPRGR